MAAKKGGSAVLPAKPSKSDSLAQIEANTRAVRRATAKKRALKSEAERIKKALKRNAEARKEFSKSSTAAKKAKARK